MATAAEGQVKLEGNVTGAVTGLEQIRSKIVQAQQAGEKALRDTQRKQEAFRSRAISSISMLTGAFAKLGATFSGIFASFGSLAVLATSKFATFEQKMKNVQVVSGATGKEFQQLSSYAREMGALTRYTAMEAADGLYYLSQAGWKAQQQMEGLDDILSLAAATNSDLAMTSETVIAALNIFGLNASDASNVADTFTTAVGNSLATVEKLGDSLAYIGPLAKQAGWSLEETVASLGSLYNAGIKASMAGTGLRGILSRLARETPEAQKALKDMEITFKEIDPTTHSLAEILQTLVETGFGLKESTKVFAQRAGPAFLVMLNQLRKGGTDVTKTYEELLDVLDKDFGIAERKAEKQMEALKMKFIELTSAVNELLISIGEHLSPKVVTFVETLRDFVRWIAFVNESTKESIVNLGIWAASWAGIIAISSIVVAVLGSIAGAIAVVAGTMGVAFSAVAIPFIAVFAALVLSLGHAKKLLPIVKELFWDLFQAKVANKKAAEDLIKAQNRLVDSYSQQKFKSMQDYYNTMYELSEKIVRLTALANFAEGSISQVQLDALQQALLLYSKLAEREPELAKEFGGKPTGTEDEKTSEIDARVKKELDFYNYKVHILEMTEQKYVEHLERILDTEKISVEYRMDLEKDLFDIKNELNDAAIDKALERQSLEEKIEQDKIKKYQDDLNHKLEMDQISEEEYYAGLKRMLEAFQLTTEQKREIIEELYNFEKEKQRETLDEMFNIIEEYYELENALRGDNFQIRLDLLSEQFNAEQELRNEAFSAGLIGEAKFYEDSNKAFEVYSKQRKKMLLLHKKEQEEGAKATIENLMKSMTKTLAMAIAFQDDLKNVWKSIMGSVINLIIDLIFKYIGQAIAAATAKGAEKGGAQTAIAEGSATAAYVTAAVAPFIADEGGYFDPSGKFRSLDLPGHFNVNALPNEIFVPPSGVVPFAAGVMDKVGGGGKSVSIGDINLNISGVTNYDDFISEFEDNFSDDLLKIVSRSQYTGVR